MNNDPLLMDISKYNTDSGADKYSDSIDRGVDKCSDSIDEQQMLLPLEVLLIIVNYTDTDTLINLRITCSALRDCIKWRTVTSSIHDNYLFNGFATYRKNIINDKLHTVSIYRICLYIGYINPHRFEWFGIMHGIISNSKIKSIIYKDQYYDTECINYIINYSSEYWVGRLSYLNISIDTIYTVRPYLIYTRNLISMIGI